MNTQTILLLLSVAFGIGWVTYHPAKAEPEPLCIPDLKTIRGTVEDIQRIRVELEQQTHVLEAIRDKKAPK